MEEAKKVNGYCGFCGVHCAVVTTVVDGTVASVGPDHLHASGGLICSKGKAAPEFHLHHNRIDYPLRRTRPKNDPDPGWERCSWDEALDLIAKKLLEVRAASGAKAVAFNKGTVGATGLTDSERWLQRLVNLFGTPNLCGTTHLCQWPRDTGAAEYTFGTRGLLNPDVANSGCVVLWGSNPSANFLNLAVDVAAAKSRGAKLIVIDPRRIGLANKADMWLQIRPGSDGALALSLINILINQRGYDEKFVREWTNAPLLLRDDTGGLLTAADVTGDATQAQNYVAVAEKSDALLFYDVGRGVYNEEIKARLRGGARIRLAGGGEVSCRPVFDALADIASEYDPEKAAQITGVPAEKIIATAHMLTNHRPVSHYFHNGLVQHTNATQSCRAIEVLYALIGDFDNLGGNVTGSAPHVNDVSARAALSEEVAKQRLGYADRPIGPPANPGTVAAYDLYRAVLDGDPYPIRALVSFGANTLLANGDTLRGRAALEKLEFFAQIELVHTPTSRFADVLLPAASWLESAALKIGQVYPVSAMADIRFREAAVSPVGERWSDVKIIFALATRLGLEGEFWGGDISAAYDYLLAPSGLTLDKLRKMPYGTSAPRNAVNRRAYAEILESTGAPRGFQTPSKKVELFSTRFFEHGLEALPKYSEPVLSPISQPSLARRFPLILTNAKQPQFLHSQHHGIPSLRKIQRNPIAELHSQTAAQYEIASGEWIIVETPDGSVRVQSFVTDSIMPGVVCCSHGWWESCPELDLPGFDPFSNAGANQNLLVTNESHDPVSGGTSHRSTLCRITKAVR